MMGLKRKHWSPCNYRALISLKNTRLSYQERGSCSNRTRELGSLLQALSPAQERKPQSQQGHKRDFRKNGRVVTSAIIYSKSSARQLWSYALFLIDTGGWEEGNGFEQKSGKKELAAECPWTQALSSGTETLCLSVPNNTITSTALLA